ncbi:MAG: CarD family transcriptional regulator [Hyphomicrobiaceae bacterium]
MPAKSPQTARPTVKAVAASVRKPVTKQSTPVPTEPVRNPEARKHNYKADEFIVYPAHGVGQIVAIEEQEIAGLSLELFVITFEKDKMTLRVPISKHESVGMRKLAEPQVVEKAMATLKGRARIKRTMWSRRAQEYEAKINSGDLISIAEVVRDLYRSESQPEQSYSERQLYEQALDRMAREIAVVGNLDDRGAVQRITDVLSKSAKGRRDAEEAADAALTDDVEAA